MQNPNIFIRNIYIRVRPRFFVQVGHETMYASSGNKHFFTKSCHSSMLNLSEKKFYEEYLTERPT